MPALGSNGKPVHVKIKRSRPAPVKQPGPISNREYGKIERHKRSRSYYNAYQVGFQNNPKVEKAFKQAYKGKGSEKTRVRGMAAIERERRRGPDKLAANAYRVYTRHLWERVKSEYPNPEKRPKAKVDYAKNAPGMAWVWKGHNKVHYSPRLIREFMGPGKIQGKPNPFRSTAKVVPLHEWTHTRQSKKTRRNKAKTEGGAQANEQRLAKKLKMPYFEASKDYEKWAAEMRRKYGPDWVARGQYGSK